MQVQSQAAIAYENSMEDREKLNSRAYNDVMEGKMPSMKNEYYMKCYRVWRSLSNHPNYSNKY